MDEHLQLLYSHPMYTMYVNHINHQVYLVYDCDYRTGKKAKILEKWVDDGVTQVASPAEVWKAASMALDAYVESLLNNAAVHTRYNYVRIRYCYFPDEEMLGRWNEGRMEFVQLSRGQLRDRREELSCQWERWLEVEMEGIWREAEWRCREDPSLVAGELMSCMREMSSHIRSFNRQAANFGKMLHSSYGCTAA